MTDDLERIQMLREEFDVELQRAEEAQAAVGPITATDATGAIAVSLTAEGAVSVVTSDGGWRSALSAEELPGAVLEAYQAAVTARQNVWVQATDTPADTRARPTATTNAMIDHITARMTDKVAANDSQLTPNLLGAMSEMLDQLDRATDEAFAMLDVLPDTAVQGHSTSGHAHAEVTGSGDLRAVSYDAGWLGHAHAFNVGRETTEAIRDAVRQLGDRSVAAITESSGLGALSRRTTDPDAMARFLGL